MDMLGPYAGVLRAVLGPSTCTIGVSDDQVTAELCMSGPLGAILSYLGVKMPPTTKILIFPTEFNDFWAHPDPILGPLVAILGPYLGHLGATWGPLGTPWSIFRSPLSTSCPL